MKLLIILTLLNAFVMKADDYLFIHGLNTNQSMLNDITKLVEARGHKVHRLILSGHRNNEWEEFTQVKAEQWEQDFLRAYQKLGPKKHLIGYSLGALVSLYAASKNKEIRFQSAYLFSPAISTRWYVSTLKAFSWIGIKKLKSQVPDNERVHSHTPLPAYMAMFQMQDWLTQSEVRHLDFGKTIVLMDERDKLVSDSGVRSWIEVNGYKWSFQNLKSIRSAHHMVLSKKYLDPSSWKTIQDSFSGL